MASETGIGAAVKRKEDARFITGKGRYTDDVNARGQAYAVFARSPHARAKINRIDTAAAAATDGVVAVFTGADLQADGIGDLPCGWLVKSKDGSDMVQPPHPPIAIERVNYVGEPYAVVVGDTLEAARNGAEAVLADFEELPAVVDLASAASAERIHEAAPDNQCYDWELGDQAATDAAFENARHVVHADIVNNRLIPNAIEPRAALGEYDAAAGSYTLHTTSQNPHLERLVLAAFVNVAPEARLRVISPDVGGGFGSKIFVYAEETAVIWAAGKLKRPVKWKADRSESFLADAHGRDHVTRAELALAEDGEFLGLRVKTIANMGAYLSTFASSVPTYLYGTLLAGQYKTPAIYVEVRSLFTNTAPVDAYRGAGRPEATYVVETIVEKAARELGMDPADIRRRNFIQPTDWRCRPASPAPSKGVSMPKGRRRWRWAGRWGAIVSTAIAAPGSGCRAWRRRRAPTWRGWRPSPKASIWRATSSTRRRKTWGRASWRAPWRLWAAPMAPASASSRATSCWRRAIRPSTPWGGPAPAPPASPISPGARRARRWWRWWARACASTAAGWTSSPPPACS